MEIYEFKGEETDWVIAPNIKEAKEFYTSLSGITNYDLSQIKVRKMLKDELSNSYLLDTDSYEPDEEDQDENYNEDDYCNGYKIISTFEDILKTQKSTDIIATTAF